MQQDGLAAHSALDEGVYTIIVRPMAVHIRITVLVPGVMVNEFFDLKRFYSKILAKFTFD